MKPTHYPFFGLFIAFILTTSLWQILTSGQPTQAAPAYTATQLALIGEQEGYVASETAVTPDCTFSANYQLYLCPEPKSASPITGSVAQRQAALAAMGTSGVLLIPESTNDRIMIFDATTGDLILPDLIQDPDQLGTPIHAILDPQGQILVSDQISDVVYAYTLDGNYVDIFAPSGGVNTAVLDNVRGLALKDNGHLLVSVGGGTNAHAIAEFDTTGSYTGNFIANNNGGLLSPFDIYNRGTDWLVGGIDSNALHRYHLTTGAYLANLASVDNFPEQIAQAANGNVLVANFSGTQEGIIELLPNGTLVDVYNPAELAGYRGVYELPNGNLLVTTGSGVHEINRSGNLVETKLAGVSARFIQFVAPTASLAVVLTVGTNPAVCATTTTITVPPGTAVTYCYQVNNTGPVSLSNHTVEDSELGVLLSNLIYNLSPTASAFFTTTATINSDTTSTATWSASNSTFDIATASTSAPASVITQFNLFLPALHKP